MARSLAWRRCFAGPSSFDWLRRSSGRAGEGFRVFRSQVLLARFRTHGSDNGLFRRPCFGNEASQGLRRIAQQAFADRSFSRDETAKGTFVDAKPPGRGRRAAKYLDAMGELSGEVIG